MDISSGVEYIYSKNVLHLDIKAENILLSEGCRTKICDFGFSVQRAVEPVLWDGGTPTYTPPEFLRTGKRGRPADIWDCGLVMMFVLGMWPLPPPGKWTIANNRIEKGDAATQMLEWFVEVERSKERIPDKYFLLLKMLAINPSHRITSSNSLQWVYLGRIVFEDSVPAEAIALSIEFTRLRIYATSLAQSLMAEHIRDIILADALLYMDGYGRDYNANLYAIIPQHIESAAILPDGHPVRGVLAMVMEGFSLTNDHKFQEIQEIPGFAADVLAASYQSHIEDYPSGCCQDYTYPGAEHQKSGALLICK